jgi:hypothetical protein
MKFYLIVAEGKQQGLPIPIEVDLFMIGRAKMCQLRSKLPGVGRQHCAVVRRERKVFVRDLGCGEPTLVNSAVITPNQEWPLHPGDILEVGPLVFMLQFRETTLSQRDLEEWALRCLDITREDELDDDFFPEPRALPSTPAAAAAFMLDKLQAKRGQIKGRLRIGRDGGITIVRFNDIILVDESEIALVKKELTDNLSRPNLRVLLDFKNVYRLSTAGVTMIEEVYRWLKPWGSSLALYRIRRELQNNLKTLEVAQAVPIFADKKTAMLERW